MYSNHLLLWFSLFHLLRHHFTSCQWLVLQTDWNWFIGNVFRLCCINLILCNYIHANEALFEVLSCNTFLIHAYISNLLSVRIIWTKTYPSSHDCHSKHHAIRLYGYLTWNISPNNMESNKEIHSNSRSTPNRFFASF
jgi:hypothetical protein